VQVDPFADVEPSLAGGVISIGNFDGIHRGHCRLLARLRQRAHEHQTHSIAVSFEPHPLKLVRPDSTPPSLVWPERKVDLLKASGADHALLLQTTSEFLSLSAESFFQDVVRRRMGAKGMVEGRNFCYGKARSGTIDVLSQQCQTARIGLDVIDIIESADCREISSSQIRRELSAGRVEEAMRILGRPHRFRGIVVAGDKRGRSIGFPTANLAQIPVMLPSNGVYACRAWVGEKHYPAAVNIGPNPTFGIHAQKVEAHLLDFADDLYEQAIEIDLIAKLRDVHPFASLDDLKNQLAIDIEKTRRIEAKYRHPFGCDLGQTISQWIDLELMPTIRPLGGSIEGVQLTRSELAISLRWAGPTSPHLLTTGEVSFVNRLRQVFPEVDRVCWTG
jgi:riboflavin kinase/FMN adenylyltransferase